MPQEEFEEEFSEEVVFRIDPTDLQDAFCSVPAELAYWSHKYALAYRAAATAKANEKQVRGAYREVAREQVIAIRGKATEADVAAKLESIDEVREASDATIEAEYEKTRLFGIVDAVRTKKEMLISVGAQVRAEMDHDPTIRAHHRNSRLSAENHEWGGKDK